MFETLDVQEPPFAELESYSGTTFAIPLATNKALKEFRLVCLLMPTAACWISAFSVSGLEQTGTVVTAVSETSSQGNAPETIIELGFC